MDFLNFTLICIGKFLFSNQFLSNSVDVLLITCKSYSANVNKVSFIVNYLGDNLLYILIIFIVLVGLIPQETEFDLISHSMLGQWHF